MDNRSDYPAEPRNLGCELSRVFSQPERNGFATGTLISPSQARRNSSRAWRVGRTEDSPDERELGRRSALRGNGRPKGSAVFGVIDPGATEVRVPCGISASFIWSDRGRLTIRGGDGDALTCSSRGESACRISPPRPSSYRRYSTTRRFMAR